MHFHSHRNIFTSLTLLSLITSLLVMARPSAASVSVTAFFVETNDNGISIFWETESELDHLGFNIWRTELGGAFANIPADSRVRINSNLIPPTGGITGGSYQIDDTSAEVEVTYYYWLESVGVNSGDLEYSGPIEARRSQNQSIGQPTSTATTEPTPVPTAVATTAPTEEPTQEATVVATEPAAEATAEPTAAPTEAAAEPTATSSSVTTSGTNPTATPLLAPTETPLVAPTEAPLVAPTATNQPQINATATPLVASVIEPTAAADTLDTNNTASTVDTVEESAVDNSVAAEPTAQSAETISVDGQPETKSDAAAEPTEVTGIASNTVNEPTDNAVVIGNNGNAVQNTQAGAAAQNNAGNGRPPMLLWIGFGAALSLVVFASTALMMIWQRAKQRGEDH